MRTLLFWPCIFLAIGCVGSIAPDLEGKRPPPGKGEPEPDPGPEPPTEPPGACATAASAWQTNLLTREQYVNAASDLLGFDVRPQVAFSDLGGRRQGAGVSLTALQVEERQQTGEAIAAVAVAPANLPRLLGCDPSKPADPACVEAFVNGIGSRGFRRPLNAETKRTLRKLFDAGNTAGGLATAVQWTVTGILQSPDFLYQVSARSAAAKGGQIVHIDDHTMANRLSFFLWNSPPDATLRSAATRGALRTSAGIRDSVARMLKDPRARRMREDYHVSWLKLDELEQVGRDAAEFTPALGKELRHSVLAAVHHLYDTGAKIEALLGNSNLFVNEALGKVYGLAATGATLKSVSSRPEERWGILTHPALLTFLAAADSSDPIKRGVFVAEELLCQAIPDPAPDIPELSPVRPGVSTRQRLEEHRANPACAACHDHIDPIGLAFENYDLLGRYRTVDQGVPVDSSGDVSMGIDLDGKYAAGMDLIRRLPGSAAIRDCMAQRWFEYAVSRAIVAPDTCALDAIKTRFRADGDLIGLIGAIAEAEAFRYEQVPQE